MLIFFPTLARRDFVGTPRFFMEVVLPGEGNGRGVFREIGKPCPFKTM
jgi:hypothetical protein